MQQKKGKEKGGENGQQPVEEDSAYVKSEIQRDNVRVSRAIIEAQKILDQDLVTANTTDRNWKGIIIAVLVIATVLGLIVTSVVLLTPPDEGPRVKGKRFDLLDIFGPDFQPSRLNGTWISETEWVFRDAFAGVSILNVSDGSSRTLISNYTLRRFNAVSYSLSSDLQFALLTHDVQKVHRYSYDAKYTLYDIETGESRPVSIEGKNQNEGSTFQLAKWLPLSNSLVLIHQGDIYIRPNPRFSNTIRITHNALPGVIYNGIPDWLYEEEILNSNSAIWMSSNGLNLLFLTFNDSLVQEHHMLHYGPLEDPFLYPQVKSIRYPKPGTLNPTVKARIVELQPEARSNKMDFRLKDIRPPDTIAAHDHYITAGGWIGNSNSEVALVWTIRSYNLSVVTICSIRSGNCNEVFRVTSEKRGWVENIPFPTFSVKNPRNFITIGPIRDGENGFFDHLIYVDTDNQRSHPLTHGTFDVFKILSWDEKEKNIYFIAIPSNQPGERHLYRLRVEHPFIDHSPDCLSCYRTHSKKTMKATAPPKTGDDAPGGKSHKKDVFGKDGKKINRESDDRAAEERQQVSSAVMESNGRNRGRHEDMLPGDNRSCSFVNQVKFSPLKSYFILECGGPGVPYIALYTLLPLSDDEKLRDHGHHHSHIQPSENPFEPPIVISPTNPSNPRLISILQNNDALIAASEQMAFPQVKNFAVHLIPGHTVHVRLLLPPALREDEITKYPLILNVYGGPGTQLAMDRWVVDYATYLASKKDYIVAQVDSRGSGGRGWDFQHKVFYKLGLLETLDQIEVVRYLKENLHFVEPKKIGVWGWSYGGYLTAMIMSNKESNDLFQCAAAIAPVTNWKLYDSAYTERYMGTPNITDNYKGYADSDVTRNLDHFQDKMFYLIHGTFNPSMSMAMGHGSADDNVHMGHSMLLAKALIAKKILFRQQVYPDEQHNLKGVQLHLHKSLDSFFEDCFRKQRPPELGTGLNKGGKFEDFD